MRIAILATLVALATSSSARADMSPEAITAARKQCVDVMNADPSFADGIVRTAEEQLRDKVNKERVTNDTCTVGIQTDNEERFAKNQKHVYLAYAAMWLVAVGFLVFLWRRQQRLVGEIVTLRRDLDNAESEAAAAAKKPAKSEPKKPATKAEPKKSDPKAGNAKKSEDDDEESEAS